MEQKKQLSNLVFDIKDKLTDEEYKNIMDGIKKINEKIYVKIRYDSFIAGIDYDSDEEPAPKITRKRDDKICKVLDKPSKDCQYHNIACDSVIDPDIFDVWLRMKDSKSFWPQIFQGGENAFMVVFGIEKL